MRDALFPRLAAAIKAARTARGLTQAMLAERLGRAPARVSEFETDLTRARLGKDRLSMLAEICDALDLVPILAPREDLEAIEAVLSLPQRPRMVPSQQSLFDEVFVDLSDDPDKAS